MNQQDPNGIPADIQPWELAMIAKVARAFRTDDRDELMAELARKVVVLKSSKPTDIRNWKAYLAKLLYNKASNWVRDERARLKRETAAVQDETAGYGFYERPSDYYALWAQALVNLSTQLDPRLRRLWQLLLEDGNQSAAARRLGRHRNTVRLWIKRIEAILRRQGCNPDHYPLCVCDRTSPTRLD